MRYECTNKKQDNDVLVHKYEHVYMKTPIDM